MVIQVESAMKTHRSQRGIAFIVIVFMIALATTVLLLKAYNPADLRVQQAKKTEQSLAVAKQALLAYAAEPITALPADPPLTCANNCPRPGDLPCPDTDNNGEAEASCSTSQVGRLPWKTLGIDDLRDGVGERLWYAVSNQYKNSPRQQPLNSDSVGTISLRNSQGSLLYDATIAMGLVAVVIAPGEVITRSDGIGQNRNAANINLANHYLDIALGEDNASFTEGTSDGFVSGEVEIAGQKVVNDMILPITRDEMNAVMEPRVLAEAMQSINYFYTVNRYYPAPADITDTSCLGGVAILNDAINANCATSSTVTLGRIPLGSSATPPSTDVWVAADSNSILRGESNRNWFQQNGWRDLILYAVAPACTSATLNCLGAGYLTLNNATTPLAAPTPNNKQVVLIASGKILAGQARSSNVQKSLFLNYIEDAENLDLDYTYTRHIQNATKNDRLITTP